MSTRRQMIEPMSKVVSVRKQCAFLSLYRSNVYYEAQPTSKTDLALMRRIDEIHLERPFYGSRRMTVQLCNDGHLVNRKLVQRLMRTMGIEGMAPGPNTSRPHPEHPVYPYLLRNIDISRANHVWATDITYIPMARGFGYLVAIMDWYSRKVLAWRLSNTLDTQFCVDALQEAVKRYGAPEIFNTDQGAQFTSSDFTDVLKGHGIRISMDGKGRCMDNVFVERLWRSVKYEEVYLHAYEDLREGREGIGRYLRFYNQKRPHQSFDYETPANVYFASLAEAA